MIFRQLFDPASSTYTYLLAGRRGAEALLIDPVLERIEQYVRLMRELDVMLVKAVDTHIHADHLSGLGELRNRTRCITVMGEEADVDVVSIRIRDGDRIAVEGLSLGVIHTPGHTDDSYSFVMSDRVFTGDTLLIRGTGRTDFQNGNALQQYDSIFNKLLRLPDATLVYPAHDYKGETVSTIGEERAFNPRLQVRSAAEYAELMARVKLASPQLMDLAVPANRRIGLDQISIADRGWSVSVEDALQLADAPDVTLVDLREEHERARCAFAPGALLVPYTTIDAALRPGGRLRELTSGRCHRIILFCAHGERSAMAVATLREAGVDMAFHIHGGVARAPKR